MRIEMVLSLIHHIAPVPSTGIPGNLAFLWLQKRLPNIEPHFVVMADRALASRAQ
jgi:hypothetical protein